MNTFIRFAIGLFCSVLLFYSCGTEQNQEQELKVLEIAKLFYNVRLSVENDFSPSELAYQNQEVRIGRTYSYCEGYSCFPGTWRVYILAVRFYFNALTAVEVAQNFEAVKDRWSK